MSTSIGKVRELNEWLIAEILKQPADFVSKPWTDSLGRITIPDEFSDRVVVDFPEINAKVRLSWLGRIQVHMDTEWVDIPTPWPNGVESTKEELKRGNYLAALRYAALGCFEQQIDALRKSDNNPLNVDWRHLFRRFWQFIGLVDDIVYSTVPYREKDGTFRSFPGWALGTAEFADVSMTLPGGIVAIKPSSIWMVRIPKHPECIPVVWNASNDPSDPVDESVLAMVRSYVDLLTQDRRASAVANQIAGRTQIELSPTCVLFNPEAASSN